MNDVEWRRSVEQRLRELNQKVKPSKRASVGGGGSGGDGITWYEETTKAELPNTDIARRSLASAEGQVFVRNPANTGWDSITHLE